jgi:D-sedoheptulose 7-phosphate isomerase
VSVVHLGAHRRDLATPPATVAQGAAGARTGSTRVQRHLDELHEQLAMLDAAVPTLTRWAGELRRTWAAGGRLLVGGNGGSASLAEHLTAELVGRYQDEHEPWSAISLAGDTAALTAIANDYGYDEVFARQVRAHGRAGDVVLLMSTSGRSPNLLSAARAAREAGVRTWALVGHGASPLAALADDVVGLGRSGPVAQELQQVAVHLLCELVEDAT